MEGIDPDLQREEGQSKQDYILQLKGLFHVLTHRQNLLHQEKSMPLRLIENRLRRIEAEIAEMQQTKEEISRILRSLHAEQKK